jgi:hypothetical protein
MHFLIRVEVPIVPLDVLLFSFHINFDYVCPNGEHTTQGTDTHMRLHQKARPFPRGPQQETHICMHSSGLQGTESRPLQPGTLWEATSSISQVMSPPKVPTLAVTCKVLMNAIISDPLGKTTCIDIKDFYPGNPLPNKEYIKFHHIIRCPSHFLGPNTNWMTMWMKKATSMPKSTKACMTSPRLAK